jgi:predicted transcriptional regulator of viral defense system
LTGRKTIGGISYQLIKVARARLGDAEFLTITDGVKIPFASPGRALLDAFYDWSRFGTIPKAFEWVKGRIDDHHLIGSLIKATMRFGNVGTIRRVGYVLAASGVEENDLRPLRKRLKMTKSYPPLIPSSPKRGHIDLTWGLVING